MPTPSTTSQDGVQARLNKALSMKNQFNGNFAWQHNNAGSTNAFGFLDSTHTDSLDISADLEPPFQHRVFSTLRFDFSRQSSLVSPYFANRANVSGSAGITGNDQDPLYWGPPSLSFTGSAIMGLSDANARDTRNQTSWLSYSTFWNHRSHNVNFGGDYRRQQFNYLSQQNPRGSFSFTGAATEAFSNGRPVPGTGMRLRRFSAGRSRYQLHRVRQRRQVFPRFVLRRLSSPTTGASSPGLSLNAGLRWEYSAPITEKYGRLVNLDVRPASRPRRRWWRTIRSARSPGSIIPIRCCIPTSTVSSRAWARVASDAGIVAGGPRGLRHLLQHVGLSDHRASRWRSSRRCRRASTRGQQRGQSADAGRRVQRVAERSPRTPSPSIRISASATRTTGSSSVQRDLPGSLVMTATYLGIKGTRGMQEFLPNTYPAGRRRIPAPPARRDTTT